MPSLLYACPRYPRPAHRTGPVADRRQVVIMGVRPVGGHIAMIIKREGTGYPGGARPVRNCPSRA
jgi:hypothetical protein